MQQQTSQAIQSALAKCAASGAKLTPKRQDILQILLEAKSGLSAYDVVEKYNQTHDHNIQAMSVYRILDFLISENLVHKLNVANQYIACAHISCDHEHASPHFLICKNCDKVKEVYLDKKAVEQLSKTIQSAGFQLSNSQLELKCLCDKCS